MTIKTQAEYEAALTRITELGSLPDGTPGAETELTTLVELTTSWEAEHGENGPAEPVVIDSLDDYEQATRLIADLDGSAEGSLEARRLQLLVDAVRTWDRDHDDATRWK